MTELTLEQWKERALVAEALLEEPALQPGPLLEMMEGEEMAAIRYGFGPFDYGGLHEVAEFLGVTKQTILNWRRSFDDWPEPVATLRMGPVYRLCDIRDWRRRQNPRGHDNDAENTEESSSSCA